MNINSSLKDIIKKTVSSSFEEMMLREFEKIENEFKNKLDLKIVEAKKEIKKQANSMTLELLHKMDINGISVEFKL